MNKISKATAIITLLLLMLTFFSSLVFYQEIAELPFYFLPVTSYPLIGRFLAPLLFWLSVIFLIICLFALLGIIFYPKRIRGIKLQENQGRLTIDQKAIKGFVNSVVEKENFMAPPKIKVIMTKHKIKVKIIGDLRRTSDLYEKSDLLISEISDELKRLIGVKQAVAIEVVYQGYQAPKKQSARVL